jgi:hypothetical protein
MAALDLEGIEREGLLGGEFVHQRRDAAGARNVRPCGG